jgi:tRNA A37 threonylcarbamoyladenosine biosynthesis protein TsaE
MYSPETHVLISHEKYKDRLREIEHLQLLRHIEQQGLSSKIYQKIASRLGIQLVNWGTKLQSSPNPDTGCQEAPLKISITTH